MHTPHDGNSAVLGSCNSNNNAEASGSGSGRSEVDGMSRSAQSRENTPSTMSSHSLDTAPLDRTTSSASVSIAMEEGSGSSFGQASQETQNEDDVERFLRKIDMEKKMQALQQRLELASVKATNGWTDMPISEIEKQRLTPRSASRKEKLSINPTSPSTSRVPYEPPSPARPWQLIDVLWQPLPPPSAGSSSAGGRFPLSPTSPSSPRKRSRDEPGGSAHFHPSQQRVGILQQQQQTQRPAVNGHRRSSSTAFHPATAASPLRHFKEGEKKKRSHSHSTHTNTTRQDVDAAKALTFMLGSSGGEQENPQGMFGPPLNAASSSLPIPPAGSGKAQSTFRARAQSEINISPRKKAGTPPAGGGGETDDKTAADLMLFLAHSPSPVTRVAPAPARMNEVKGAARVLFQDGGDNNREIKQEPRIHSNLAMAPPITNDTAPVEERA